MENAMTSTMSMGDEIRGAGENNGNLAAGHDSNETTFDNNATTLPLSSTVKKSFEEESFPEKKISSEEEKSPEKKISAEKVCPLEEKPSIEKKHSSENQTCPEKRHSSVKQSVSKIKQWFANLLKLPNTRELSTSALQAGIFLLALGCGIIIGFSIYYSFCNRTQFCIVPLFWRPAQRSVY